ncbi:uncharacterized protein [Parasteatoda tepidariorum]|uniref:uncharacterized protein isoform X2 n=1 Tax=Parasteatoda tepidariorum TaxID=114398 RepID=UPI001C720BC7|nr:uncharacterized protein LOC122268279 [Parasteatoda tepidariorum]
MNLFSFYLILAFGIASVYQSSSEHCNEEKLKKCLNIWPRLMNEFFLSSKIELIKSDLDIYCGRVEEDGKCLENAAADCKKKYPLKAATFASLLNILKCQPGTDRRPMYLKIVPCIENHVSQFDKCLPVQDHKHIEDGDLEILCKGPKIFLCTADASRKVCGKDGELLAKSIEDDLKDIYKDVCSGAYAIVFNVLLITCSVIIGYCF